MSKAPAVDYALEIIEYFAKNDKELGITDLSNGLNINKNAISRILEALCEKKWIYLSDENNKKYKLTLKPFSIIARNNENNEIVKISKPYLEKLNNELQDSVYLGVKVENSVVYLLHLESKKDVKISGRIGGNYPLRTTAPGKILLAYNKKIPKDFEAEAKEIIKNGYAIDNEEFGKGIICVACPIFDSNNDVIATIGISSLTIYDTIETLINNKLPYIKETAEDINCNLSLSR